MKNKKNLLRILMIPGGGTEMSLKRLNECLENKLHTDKDIIVFTGGGRLSGSMTEADFMADIYSEHKSRNDVYVIVENKSRDTYENIAFSLMKINDYISLLGYIPMKIEMTVATDSGHLKRFKLSWSSIQEIYLNDDIYLQPKFVALWGWRSLKEHFIELLIFAPMHWYSPTGTLWPVSALINWQRKKRNHKLVD